jgi:hypothetical protein
MAECDEGFFSFSLMESAALKLKQIVIPRHLCRSMNIVFHVARRSIYLNVEHESTILGVE